MATINMHLKFQSKLDLHFWNQVTCRVQKPKKFNMAARWPFWKWRCRKSTSSYPYTYVLCCWSLKLIFKAKVKLECGNQKIQYGRQAAILKVMLLKINRLLPLATINMHMKLKFQSRLDLCSGNHVVFRQTDERTDGLTDKVNPVYPPPTSLRGGINIDNR